MPQPLSAAARLAQRMDHHVAARVRGRREENRLSLKELATIAGISETRIDKFENLKTRISAGELLLLATALQCEPRYFFEGFVEENPE